MNCCIIWARRPGQAVSRGQLLRDVWGYPTEDDPSRTVDYHIKSLRAKLGDDPANPRYIETLRGTGYRWLAPEAHEA